MTYFIIKETVNRKEFHPEYIDTWFHGKNTWVGEATLPIQPIAKKFGWKIRKHAETRLHECRLVDEQLHIRYPDTPYTRTYEIIEVEV